MFTPPINGEAKKAIVFDEKFKEKKPLKLI